MTPDDKDIVRTRPTIYRSHWTKSKRRLRVKWGYIHIRFGHGSVTIEW